MQTELDKLGLHYGVIDLGEVEVEEALTTGQLDQLRRALLTSGLELMDDKKAILIERIKNVIVVMVHQADQQLKLKNSDYISQKLDYDYTYLANVFSAGTGVTIERYIIAHKIEKVKELLLYNELNLTQIANQLNYSSVSHLSSQFKRITGLTPTLFKQLKDKDRINLENV